MSESRGHAEHRLQGDLNRRVVRFHLHDVGHEIPPAPDDRLLRQGVHVVVRAAHEIGEKVMGLLIEPDRVILDPG